MLEHFVHALIQILDVFVGIVGKRIARAASPDQLLGLGIEEIDDHRAHLVGIGRCCRLTETATSEAPPTPTSSKSVVEGIQGLLILRHLNGDDGDVTIGINLGPAFCCQRSIDSTLDAINIQGIFRLNVFPRIGLVLREVSAAVLISLALLRWRLACEEKHHSNQNEHHSVQFHSFHLLPVATESFSVFSDTPRKGKSLAKHVHCVSD